MVVGTGHVRSELQGGRVRVVVLASDRSLRTRDKVERLALARGVPVMTGPDAAALGRRVGRGTVQAVGVVDQQLADGLVAKSGRSPAGGQSGE